MKKTSFLLITLTMLAFLMEGALAAKTPIRLVTYGSNDAVERYRKLSEAFNSSHPEYDLQVEVYSFAEYPTKLQVMFAAGSPPDVFMTWAQYKAVWAEKGMLMDVGPLWEQSSVTSSARVFPFMMDAAKYNGRIYGVPYDYSATAMVLNLDALAASGLAEPGYNWTVDDFKDYAIRLTKPNEDFYGSSSGAHWSINNWQWSVVFTGQGWLSEDRTEVLVDKPEYVSMLQFWRDLMHVNNAVPMLGKSPSRDIWQGGYAMWNGYVHYGPRLDTAPYDWSMTTFPQGPGGQDSFAQGHMWSIPSAGTDAQKGWAVLEWFLSPEGQRLNVLDGRQPLSNDVALWNQFFGAVSSGKRAKLQDLVMNVLYGKDQIHNMEYWTTWPEVDRIMNRHLATVFRGTESPGNAMTMAAEEIRALLPEK